MTKKGIEEEEVEVALLSKVIEEQGIELEKKVALLSKEQGIEVEEEAEVTLLSDAVIPLPIEYCRKKKELVKFDPSSLRDHLHAASANYADVGLVDLICKTVLDMVITKEPEEKIQLFASRMISVLKYRSRPYV